MGKKHLIYMPLGGAGEIGMNMYVYGYGPPGEERFILVDTGVAFPDMRSSPGVDLILPDFTWILDRADRLDGIFITHAHEDHVGAIGHVASRIKAPIYSLPFTGIVVRTKLEEQYVHPGRLEISDPYPARKEAGPFAVSFLPVSHSVPESSSLVIDSPAGRIIHTGDFKIDLTPTLGTSFDFQLWKSVAEQGILAIVCDSTNSFITAAGRSESETREPITDLMSRSEGLFVATTFASNIARVRQIALAGQRCGRQVVLLGRAMERMVGWARQANQLGTFPPILRAERGIKVPRNEILLIVTGSQGEPRSASSQLAYGKFRGFSLGKGDTFLYSSKTIPGNEKGVASVINRLTEKGVRVIDDSAAIYHVSGHANAPDLLKLHRALNPGMVIPMHGEARHLAQHAHLAKTAGFASIVVANGNLTELRNGSARIIERIGADRLFLDGKHLISGSPGVVKERIRLACRGSLVAFVFLNRNRRRTPKVRIVASGLPPSADYLEPKLKESLENELQDLPREVFSDTRAVENSAIHHLRRRAKQLSGKRPIVTAIVQRAG